MSKIMVISDLHLDAVSVGVERYDGMKRKLMQVVEVMAEEQPDELWCLGDISDPSNRAVDLVCDFGEWLRDECYAVDFTCIAGNHDVIEGRAGLSTLRPLELLSPQNFEQTFDIFTRPAFQRRRNYDLVVLPFTNRAADYNATVFIEELGAGQSYKAKDRPGGTGKPVFIIGHLSIEGIHPGSETEDMPRGRDMRFPLSACKKLFPDAMLMNGHYHTPQVFDGIHIPGSLERLTFSDKHDPSFMIIEV